MFNLFGYKKIIYSIIFLFLISTQTSFPQANKGNNNYLDFQAKSYYFGITMAYNNSNFRVKESKNIFFNDSIRTIQSVRGPGFNLGIVTNLKLGEYFDVRFLPTLSFAEKILPTNIH